MVLAVKVNLTHCGTHSLLSGDEDVGWENLEALNVLGRQLGRAVKYLDTLDLISPEDDAQHDVFITQENINRVALDTEGTHPQVGIAA